MSRTIVITGTASGIGYATAAMCEQRGNRVIRVDIREGDIVCDLGTPAGRAQLVSESANLSPQGIDGIVACAGLGAPNQATVAVNFFGAVATLQGLRPLLEKSTAPRAVLFSSRMSIYRAIPTLAEQLLAGDEIGALATAAAITDGGTSAGMALPIYATTKVAVTRWMRRVAGNPEWAGKGILLNAVAPGLTVTPMTAAALADPLVGRIMRDYHPESIGRFARPNEIAELVFWLLSEANSMLVGQCIFIDGGTELIERGDHTW